MKKKFSLWLNVVTICLCVCAIAIGVYAAQQATLTVSGQLGFTAHGIEMNATAYIYGHATSEDGEPISEENKVSLIGTDANSTEDDTKLITGSETLNFTQDNSAIYFSDMTSTDANGKPDDIIVVVTLTATANLKFDVAVSASGTSVDTDIQITTEITNTVVKYQGEAAEKTTTITFTLSLQPNAQGVYEDVADTNKVTLNIQLEKYKLSKETITVHQFTAEEIATKTAATVGYANDEYGMSYSENDSYANLFPYYINFGKTSTGTDVRWLIVGKDNGSDTITALTAEDKTQLATGHMDKDTNYYLLSEHALHSGISFQNQYTNSGTYPNAYGVNANDYATSNIRAYLNGASVQPTSSNYAPSGTAVDFDATYTFSPAELDAIQPREVSSLMNGLSVNKGTISTAAPTTEPEAITNTELKTVLKQTADNFWLLSSAEVSTIFGVAEGSNGAPVLATVEGATSPCNWWLRSPSAVYGGDWAWSVNNGGDVCDDGVSNVSDVRPAFKI